MWFQSFSVQVFSKGVGAVFSSMSFAYVEVSPRNQVLHVQKSQFNVLCFLSRTKPGCHALSCCAVNVNEELDFLCQFRVENQVSYVQCFGDSLSYRVQPGFSWGERFLAQKSTGQWRSLTTTPEVDFRARWQPAQSLSTKQSKSTVHLLLLYPARSRCT